MNVPGAVTDPDRVTGELCSYPAAAAAMNCYLATPTAPGSYPGIIIVHEAFGLNDHIRDLARRFANIGFNALAPDLYTHKGQPDVADITSVLAAMYGLRDDEVLQQLEAGAAFLRDLKTSNSKVAIIGFCAGGRQTLLMACSSSALNAAIDCWGGFIRRASPDELVSENRPVPPITRIAGLGCPTLVVIGTQDQNPSVEDGEALRQAAAAHALALSVSLYEDAGHAFLADYRPTYRAGPAFRVWDEIVGFLEEKLQ
jgi:carboxymethylenebutenolidase